MLAKMLDLNISLITAIPTGTPIINDKTDLNTIGFMVAWINL
jgi:hypothetical protein